MARCDRVAQALKEEVSNIIQYEIKDHRLGFVTIARVELTPDLRYAKIFFSVLGQEKDYEKTAQALNSATGFIRRLIAQRIDLRLVPEISFREDHSCEYSIKIQKILDEVKQLTKPEAANAKKSRRRRKAKK